MKRHSAAACVLPSRTAAIRIVAVLVAIGIRASTATAAVSAPSSPAAASGRAADTNLEVTRKDESDSTHTGGGKSRRDENFDPYGKDDPMGPKWGKPINRYGGLGNRIKEKDTDEDRDRRDEREKRAVEGDHGSGKRAKDKDSDGRRAKEKDSDDDRDRREKRGVDSEN